MKYSELKEILKQHGCYKSDEGSKHEKWYGPLTGGYFPIARHDGEDVRRGTYHAILKQAGISR